MKTHTPPRSSPVRKSTAKIRRVTIEVDSDLFEEVSKLLKSPDGISNVSAKRKLKKLETHIPSRDALVFQTFGEHFETAPEAIMQSCVFSEFGTVYDSPYRVLSMYDQMFKAAFDLVPVELSFIPSAYCLLESASAILRRPLEELVTGMLISSAETLSLELGSALKRGGIEESPVLVEWAQEWRNFEFEAWSGRLPEDHSGFNAWYALEMEHVMPPALSTKEGRGGRQ